MRTSSGFFIDIKISQRDYRKRSWRFIRYCPSFPSKFDAPMYVTVPVFVAAWMPVLIASLMESSSMPFKTISYMEVTPSGTSESLIRSFNVGHQR